MLVDETIAQPLIHTRVSNEPDKLQHQLREYFPGSKVTQNKHDRNACAEFPRHRLDILDLNVLQDFVRWHLRKFCAAQQVCPEPAEMPPRELTQFARRFFISKGNLKIACCETPVFPGKDPRANTEEFTESEKK